MEQTNLNRLKQDLIEEINQRVADRILEPTNADLLRKLIRQADNENEAISGQPHQKLAFFIICSK